MGVGGRLAPHSIVDLGEWHQSVLHRAVIGGVSPSNPESSIDVHDQPGRMGCVHLPVDPDGRAEDQGPTRSLARSAGLENSPQPSPDDRTGRCAPQILAGRCRDRGITEAPRPQGHVDTSAVPEEFDGEPEGTDPAEGHSQPNSLPGVGARRLSAGAGGEHPRQEGEDDRDSLHCDVASAPLECEWDEGRHVARGRRNIAILLRRGHNSVPRLAGIAALGFLTSCVPPDAPAARNLSLPTAVLDVLDPDTVRSRRLYPDVVYHYAWTPDGPWAVHFIEAALDGRCDLALDVLRPVEREAGEGGRARVSEMAARSADRILAAVNADFFTPEGRAVGLEIVDGEVASRSRRPAFAWRRGSPPWIGVPSIEEDQVRLGWPVAVRDGDGRTMAVGGFPDLIDGGGRVGDLEVTGRPSFAAVRHPRTAVGYDSRSGRIWFVVVDGRQPPYSVGMSLPELATLFEALGVDEAVNLDGGGSSAMVVQQETVNRPSDITGERAVVNALALRQSLAACGR